MTVVNTYKIRSTFIIDSTTTLQIIQSIHKIIEYFEGNKIKSYYSKSENMNLPLLLIKFNDNEDI